MPATNSAEKLCGPWLQGSLAESSGIYLCMPLDLDSLYQNRFIITLLFICLHIGTLTVRVIYES